MKQELRIETKFKSEYLYLNHLGKESETQNNTSAHSKPSSRYPRQSSARFRVKAKTLSQTPRLGLKSRQEKRPVLSPPPQQKAHLHPPKIEDYEILAASSRISQNTLRSNTAKGSDIFSLTQGDYFKRPQTSRNNLMKSGTTRFKSNPLSLVRLHSK